MAQRSRQLWTRKFADSLLEQAGFEPRSLLVEPQTTRKPVPSRNAKNQTYALSAVASCFVFDKVAYSGATLFPPSLHIFLFAHELLEQLWPRVWHKAVAVRHLHRW